MKNFVIAIVLIAVMFTMIAPSGKPYPTCGVVVELDHKSDEVIFEDSVGFLWSFYGVEDWSIGDVVAVIMDDNGTEIIFDDVIVSVRYCGHI